METEVKPAETVDINAGDLVRLKSGGPLMTVNSVYKRNSEQTFTCNCSWFARYDLQSAEFKIAALEKSPLTEQDEWHPLNPFAKTVGSRQVAS